MTLGLVTRAGKGVPLTAADHDANLAALEAAAFPTDVLVVRSIDDLPDPVGDQSTLPAKVVLMAADLDLGSDALRLSAGSSLLGLPGQTVTSSNPNGVLRATNLASHVVMQRFNVLATAGPALDLTGTIDYQLNCFFMGLLGASIGTVTGFDVQAFKDVYFDATDGITIDGSVNKVFFSQCPFYTIAAGNAAITLAATLNATRVDMVNNFFKSDAASVGLRGEAGYTVGFGRVNNSMAQGPTNLLDGIASSDVNWWFDKNDLVRNSRVTAQASLDTQTTTTITTQGVYETLAGAFSLSALSQRISLNGSNELVYDQGDQPILVTLSAAVTLDPANDVRVGLQATKNGVELAYSQSYIEQGTGAANQPRPGTVVALIELDPGNTVGLSVANLTDTTDIDVLAATYTVISG